MGAEQRINRRIQVEEKVTRAAIGVIFALNSVATGVAPVSAFEFPSRPLDLPKPIELVKLPKLNEKDPLIKLSHKFSQFKSQI